MTPDDSFARRIEWRLIEQSVSKSWFLIVLNSVLAVLFAIVYLSAGRDLMTVIMVMAPRLVASALAIGILIWLVQSGLAWRSANRGTTQTLLIFQEAVQLFTFGATATVWMLEQDQSVNALSMAGIGAFGAISAVLAPRILVAATIGRVALFTPLILFCVISRPSYWALPLALCLFALALSLVIAFAVYRENVRQATLEEDLAEARLSAERALSREQAARTALEAETALRERFLHAVTHDLRQPLNALNFHLRRLRNKPTPDVTTAFVGTAESCLSSADAIIESVAGSAWMRGDLPPADLSSVALGPLLSAITAEALPLAEHHGLRLTYVPTATAVQADREYLERVIRNLVRNAIQHAQTRILIGVRRKGADIALVVVDDGPGVPMEAQDAIFEPFYQVPTGGRRSEGNVGLGLSIVAELVGAMGGKVSLNSAEGRGAAFSVALPHAIANTPIQSRTNTALVIDNEDAAADAALAVLTQIGYDANRYKGPLTAVAIANAVKPADDLILLDFHLGGGVTASDALELLSAGERAPIVIITSDTSPAIAAKARAFGVRLLGKPLRTDQIEGALNVDTPTE